MHEIIHVVCPESPSGSARQGLEIEAVSDRPLATGYYFVLWPNKLRMSRNRGKRYFGPFRTLAEARLLQRSAFALGLVMDEKVVRPVAECRSIVRHPVASNAPCRRRSDLPWHMKAAACAA